MENNEKTSLSDNLISPETLQQTKIAEKVKVITVKDGLVERANPKVITSNGKELLSEGFQGRIL